MSLSLSKLIYQKREEKLDRFLSRKKDKFKRLLISGRLRAFRPITICPKDILMTHTSWKRDFWAKWRDTEKSRLNVFRPSGFWQHYDNTYNGFTFNDNIYNN
jgi:hypothetical protein